MTILLLTVVASNVRAEPPRYSRVVEMPSILLTDLGLNGLRGPRGLPWMLLASFENATEHVSAPSRLLTAEEQSVLAAVPKQSLVLMRRAQEPLQMESGCLGLPGLLCHRQTSQDDRGPELAPIYKNPFATKA